MCYDRIGNNMPPACVRSCPTGALTFGDRKEILDMAAKRVDELKKAYPKAMALNADDVRVIYLVTDDPKKYHEYASA
jgi:formate dehydrogenase iron-sulfur subunit